MTPAPAARSLLVACLLAAACADHSSGCLHDGRWYTQGAVVTTSDVCLHCSCFHGALSCRRRSCTPLPDPPPQRCYVVQKMGSCCAELHCPDGVRTIENKEVARSNNDLSDLAISASLAHVCMEGGSMYAAGSAIASGTACEQCFCLGAVRRCIQPQCLPIPPGCRPHPALGACCPQRYYCDHSPQPPDRRHHDCMVNRKWVSEGERVLVAEASANCTQCFCLRGAVVCQPLSCAPALLGCEPLLRPGECCAHQYRCHHQDLFANKLKLISNNKLELANKKYRSVHPIRPQKRETTSTDMVTDSSFLTSSISDSDLATTIKVKRKTNDPPPTSTSNPSTIITTTQEPTTTTLLPTETTINDSTEKTETTTEQPEGSVKIIINGTINCTTEISSETIPINKTVNDINMIQKQVQPRIPIINTDKLDDHTFSSNDIITDRTVNGFDENEIFTVNVTSSLNANTNLSTKPAMHAVSKIDLSTDVAEAYNASKKTKGDYDYDYTEPTLPPSLPNLKIIPFVAADAVVDEESQKDTLTYPLLEREDKFPVYLPNIDAKKTPYAIRRADVYNSTQYPVFISNEESQYPSLTSAAAAELSEYPRNDDLEYTIPTSLANRIPETNIVTKPPGVTSTFEVETPVVNLFSPPMETEGGFIPKAPELIDDYYVPYQSTPPTAAIPHLTTSMQLNIAKGCISDDGRVVSEGDSITYACYECTCAWAKLHCSPRSCHTPKGCTRRQASRNAADLCCGELICNEDNKTTPSPIAMTEEKIKNATKVKTENFSLTIKVDTPTGYNKSNLRHALTENNKQSDSVRNNISLVTEMLLKDFQNATRENSMSANKSQVEKLNTVAAPQNNSLTLVNHTHEYEDEDDEGFSFGSVLKLLLSENYEATTLANQKISTNAGTKATYKVTTRRPVQENINPFIPLPPRPYMPPNKLQTSVSRIDHLVLGEATAINTIRPITTLSSSSAAHKTSTRPLEITKKEKLTDQYTSVTHEGPRPLNLGGLGTGMLKLAGCNIYGRMYRVGRIILELSSPCQECWCTELGVQCKELKC